MQILKAQITCFPIMYNMAIIMSFKIGSEWPQSTKMIAFQWYIIIYDLQMDSKRPLNLKTITDSYFTGYEYSNDSEGKNYWSRSLPLCVTSVPVTDMMHNYVFLRLLLTTKNAKMGETIQYKFTVHHLTAIQFIKMIDHCFFRSIDHIRTVKDCH